MWKDNVGGWGGQGLGGCSDQDIHSTHEAMIHAKGMYPARTRSQSVVRVPHEYMALPPTLQKGLHLHFAKDESEAMWGL